MVETIRWLWISERVFRKLRTGGVGSGWAALHRGWKRRWRGFFRGARRVVSGIHRDADGFHPSAWWEKERKKQGRNETERGVECCVYVHALFPASLYPLSLSPSVFLPSFSSSLCSLLFPFTLSTLFHPFLTLSLSISSSRLSSLFSSLPLRPTLNLRFSTKTHTYTVGSIDGVYSPLLPFTFDAAA